MGFAVDPNEVTHTPAEIARLRKKASRSGLPKTAGGLRVKYSSTAGVDPGATAAFVKEAGRRLGRGKKTKR